MRIFLFSLVLIISIIGLGNSANAKPGDYEPAIKQEEKRRNRWTVSEWMTRRTKDGLFNRFFRKNGFSGLFESMVDVTNVTYERTMSLSPGNKGTHAGNRATGIMSLSLFGLRGAYEITDEDQTVTVASALLRFYGNSLQDSHGLLEGGYRILGRLSATGTSESFKNYFFGGSGSLYFFKKLGFEGSAYKIFAMQSNLHNQLDGHSVHGMLFFEWNAIRFSFGARNELYRIYDQTGMLDVQLRFGYAGSMRMYF